MIGLKRGTVELFEHDIAWDIEADNTIKRLKQVLGNIAKNIQHVGSTSIPAIKAKPIIDLALAVDNFEDIISHTDILRNNGFFYRPNVTIENELLLACGNYYEGTGELQTHFIHVVLTGSMEWKNYINFREYLNANIDVAKDYEKLKISLAQDAPIDFGREKYLEGKRGFIAYTLRKALVWSYLGKEIEIKIDRPIGSKHPKYIDVIYPVNYGYIPHVIGGDGEELDVYLLGVDNPVSKYFCKIIGIVHRENDVEDKLVAAPLNMNFTIEEITNMIAFQEKYYISRIEQMHKD